MEDVPSSPKSPILNMQRKGKGKYAAVVDDKDSRWHEGHRHDNEQHFHHLTAEFPLDIETDDKEFVDPTEGDDSIRPSKFVLTSFDKLPKFLADNEYIQGGYRVHFSFKLCLLSLFRMHNETLNVWTHLIGTLLFSALAVATYTRWLPNLVDGRTPVIGDYRVFAVFFVGAHAQMLLSTIYHLFNSHSATAAKWLARFDYVGICFMIVGSYFPPLYYTLRACHPDLMTVHLCVISLLGVIGVFVTTLPRLQGPRFRVFRAVFFIIFGLYILIPLPHMVYLLGFLTIWPLFWRLGIMGALYILGAFVYASRCPERCCAPGKLDFGWYSHPIWHLFVIAAGLMQFYNCVYAFVHYAPTECP